VVDCTAAAPVVLREGAVPLSRVVEILDGAGVRHQLGHDEPGR
jgi:hypothetical protein